MTLTVLPKPSAAPRQAAKKAGKARFKAANARRLDDLGVPHLGTLAEVKAYISEQEGPRVANLLERCFAAARIGQAWARAQEFYAFERPNMTKRGFASASLGLSYERLRQCEVLARNFRAFRAAYDWITKPANADWLASAKEEGAARWGVEIIRLHQAALAGLRSRENEEAKERLREAKQRQRAEAKAEAIRASLQPVTPAESAEAVRAEVQQAKADRDWATAGAAIWQRRAIRNAERAKRLLRIARQQERRAEAAEARLREVGL